MRVSHSMPPAENEAFFAAPSSGMPGPDVSLLVGVWISEPPEGDLAGESDASCVRDRSPATPSPRPSLEGVDGPAKSPSVLLRRESTPALGRLTGSPSRDFGEEPPDSTTDIDLWARPIIRLPRLATDAFGRAGVEEFCRRRVAVACWSS
mmetsp:Transcript_117679/g.333513  ORF Transcript_117679/g.333513 Transcript_117679/m.333513 type:complete len:150 (+) Transcript_117679:785-1234(+)